MHKTPVRIAISGALGRMGKILIKQLINNYNKYVKLTAAISKSHKNYLGIDIGEILSIGKSNVKISKNCQSTENDFDVLIDFSHPNNSMEYLKFCKQNNKKIVIGTTGFSKIEEMFIKESSKKIGVLFSANFSLGMNVVYKIIKEISDIIGKKSDIKIIEYHHNKKIDSPSGTAISIKNIIEHTLSINNNMDETTCKKVDISSIRIGDVKGEHTIIFSMPGENIEITHQSINRKIFANGAIDAAFWLSSKNPGLFNMQDVIGISR